MIRRVSDSSNLPPITALSLVRREIGENSPFGFVAIENLLDNRSQNAEIGISTMVAANARRPSLADFATPNKSKGSGLLLCVNRGDGAPLGDIRVVSGPDLVHWQRLGYSQLKYTTGNCSDANLSLSTPGSKAALPMFIVFKSNLVSALAVFEPYCQLPLLLEEFLKPPMSSHAPFDSPDSLYCISLFSHVLTILSAIIISSGDQNLILQALLCFSRFPSQHMPPPLVNYFVSILCDALPSLTSFFELKAQVALLQHLYRILKTYVKCLSVLNFGKIVESAFLCRTADKVDNLLMKQSKSPRF